MAKYYPTLMGRRHVNAPACDTVEDAEKWIKVRSTLFNHLLLCDYGIEKEEKVVTKLARVVKTVTVETWEEAV